MSDSKKEKKYALVQLPADVHQRLKQYCDLHGFKLSGFVSALIRQAIDKPNKK